MLVEAERRTKFLAVAKMTHEVVAFGAIMTLRVVLAYAVAATYAALILLDAMLAQFRPAADRTTFFPQAVLAELGAATGWATTFPLAMRAPFVPAVVHPPHGGLECTEAGTGFSSLRPTRPGSTGRARPAQGGACLTVKQAPPSRC